MFKSLEIFINRRKMNFLYREIISEIKKKKSDPVEYGNIFKSKKWGVKDKDKIIWTYGISVISIEPMEYKVIYDISKNNFYCVSVMDSKLGSEDMLQFVSDDFVVVKAKIMQFVRDIPIMRDRMLREYIFHQTNFNGIKNWLNFFPKNKKIKIDHLRSMIKELRLEYRISEAELKRLARYAESLQDY